MGSGAKTKHQSYVTAPAAAQPSTVPEGVAGMGGFGSFSGEVLIGQVTEAGVEAAESAHGHVEEFCTTDFGNDYEAFLASFTVAKNALEAATDEGAGQFLTSDWDAMKEKCKEFTASLSPEDLQKIAAAHGFEHPGLVGLSYDGTGAHPLSFVVNPYYPPDSPNKITLQQKAIARWEALSAGQVVGGMTLAEYKAKFPGGAPAPGAPVKSAEELLAMHAQLGELTNAIEAMPWHVDTADTAKARANLRYDYQRLAAEYTAATCDDPDFVKPAPAGNYIHGIRSVDLPYLYDRLADDYGLSKVDVHILSATNNLNRYIHPPSPYLKALAEEQLATKKAHLESLKTCAPFIAGPLQSVGWGPPLDLPALTPSTQASTAEFFKHLGPAIADASAMGSNILTAQPVKEELGTLGTVAGTPAWYLSDKHCLSSFRAWAKSQQLPQLRTLASELGATPSECKKWTRATVQNFIAGTFSKSAQFAFEKATAPKLPPPVQAPSHEVKTPSAASAAPATKSLNGIQVPKHAKFAAKRTAVAEGLAHLAASINAVASRPSAAEVDALELTPTAAPVHGGAHSKSFLADNKGRVWMFKPDSTGGGARATAESTASALLHKVGLPSVPVYTRVMGGHKGSIQPIIEGTKTIDSSPSSWSQADLDAIVRYHVGAWMVGDHDGNPANVLRTKGGGLIPVDQGQAWKFVGRDRLDVDYHPNSSFGSIPVYHTAYKAAKQGSLAKDVRVRPEAAAPVIARFEAIPDDELREMVRPLAAEGVKTGLPWKAPMTEVAKKRFVTTTPSPKQIAEAFVETVVERKKTLRKDFTAFFNGLGFESASVLEAVA